jgi:hypothetical protein
VVYKLKRHINTLKCVPVYRGDVKEDRKAGSSRSRGNKLKDETRRDSKDHDKRDGKEEKEDEAFDLTNLDKASTPTLTRTRPYYNLTV